MCLQEVRIYVDCKHPYWKGDKVDCGRAASEECSGLMQKAIGWWDGHCGCATPQRRGGTSARYRDPLRKIYKERFVPGDWDTECKNM